MDALTAEPAEIDPRLAAAGAVPIRPDGAGGYNYPGMAPMKDWRRTAVHQATRWYGCAFCGQKFSGPHAVYTHIAKRHPKRTLGTGLRASQSAQTSANASAGVGAGVAS